MAGEHAATVGLWSGQRPGGTVKSGYLAIADANCHLCTCPGSRPLRPRRNRRPCLRSDTDDGGDLRSRRKRGHDRSVQQAARLRRGEPLAGPDAGRDALHLRPRASEYGYATELPRDPAPLAAELHRHRRRADFGRARRRAAVGRHRLAGRRCSARRCRHGRTAAIYAESMPGRCAAARTAAATPSSTTRGRTSSASAPAARRARPRRGGASAPASAPGRLPNVGMVVPNLVPRRPRLHRWRPPTRGSSSQMGKVFAGPDWKSGRLAVVLTADEDDHNQGNIVLTVVIHPQPGPPRRRHPADPLLADPPVRRGRAPARTCATPPPRRRWRRRSACPSADRRVGARTPRYAPAESARAHVMPPPSRRERTLCPRRVGANARHAPRRVGANARSTRGPTVRMWPIVRVPRRPRADLRALYCVFTALA